jgi:hypothetical protein
MVLVPTAQYELSKKGFKPQTCSLILHHLLYEINPQAEEKTDIRLCDLNSSFITNSLQFFH